MNGYDVGGRALRVDRADQEAQPPPSAHTTPTHSPQMATAGAPSGSVSVDAANATLAAMSNAQLLEVVAQMKSMAVSNPEQTRHLLLNNPSLTYAVFHAMAMMSLIDPAIVQVRCVLPAR